MTAPKEASRWLQALVLVWCLAAVVSTLLVFLTPSEGSSSIFFGLSLSRLWFVAALAAFALVFGAAYWFERNSPRKLAKLRQSLLDAVAQPVVYLSSLFVALVAAVFSFYLCLLAFKFTDALVAARLIRLLPLILWFLIASIAWLVVIPNVRGRAGKIPSPIWAIRPTVVGLVCILAVLAFIYFTGLGLSPDRADWDMPGVPLIGLQILASVIVGAVVCGTAFLLRRLGWRISRVDFVVMVGLWLAAFLLWNGTNLSPTFFSPAPRAPNFAYYPHSDAATVDIAAQRLLTGYGFTAVAEKPLYSAFLAFLHAVAGQDYSAVISVQIAFLALLPAALYLLGAQLHHRLSAGLLAMMVILREVNAISLSGQIDVSHSKLLMTDMPTTLLMVVFVLLVLQWLRAGPTALHLSLWVGGLLGAIMLLRSQVIVFLPFLLIAAIWWMGPKLRRRMLHAGLIVAGFLLMTVPWMFRNYQYTGVFGYSQPLQAMYMARQYSLTPELADPGIDIASDSSSVSLGFSKVVEFSLQHPGEVARFVSAHFFHNITSSLLVLPIRFDLADNLVEFYNLLPYWQGLEGRLWSECCALQSHIETTPYWQDWAGEIPEDLWLPLMVNVALISLGVAAVWKRFRWLALVPVAVFLIYNFSTAIARVSGWRLILPVDWVVLLFYAIGLGQMLLWAWGYLFKRSSGPANDLPRTQTLESSSRRLATVALSILLVGMVLPGLELLVPRAYEDLSAPIQAWDQIDFEGEALSLDSFTLQKGAVVYYGRALYPRYYPANQGEPGGNSAFHVQDFARTAFWIVGPTVDRVALPLDAPTEFPNAVDVVVFGCQAGNFVRAAAVVFPNSEAQDLVASSPDAFSCTE